MITEIETINAFRNELEEIVTAKNNGELSTSQAIAKLIDLKQKVNEQFPNEETRIIVQQLMQVAMA